MQQLEKERYTSNDKQHPTPHNNSNFHNAEQIQPIMNPKVSTFAFALFQIPVPHFVLLKVEGCLVDPLFLLYSSLL